ncbi:MULTISPECIES: flagellar basal body rod protein FlgB [Oceanobacillus]|uniref:Flagellar basal body rod protein FlgB n=1 Tax=Oceanobacillus oncorhynchi TaxID=545501 RepID=A0A0A1MG13_9BACI|nr:flagellar basal body rod protein FlgB [Oceanobacillus oncorhynchi]UUI42252.1 flagellar basal body rod protein FlgB [Oceanobacillus oncorhynchi]CEI84305.1 Flagellar basal body rod protein FlgB [Oceanobacillus oncorhynchi]
MDLFSGTIGNLENSIQYASAKNNVISNNISNADTPNYKADKVSFKSALENEMSGLQARTTNERHLNFGEEENRPYRIVKDASTTYNHNGNNVDIDREMSELAKNQIYYNSLIDRMNGKFSSLQSVIRGGN